MLGKEGLVLGIFPSCCESPGGRNMRQLVTWHSRSGSRGAQLSLGLMFRALLTQLTQSRNPYTAVSRAGFLW